MKRNVEWRSSLLYAPIRQLPDELLSDIFLYLFMPTELSKRSGRHPFPSFLPSSHFAPPFVCAWWRDVTIQTPHLQPMYALDLANQTLHSRYTNVDGGLPTLPYARLRLWIHSTVPNSQLPSELEVLPSLATHASRWREVKLDCGLWPVLEYIGTKLPLPHLEKLQLHYETNASWWTDAKTSDHVSFFEQAPALRALVLYNRQSLPSGITSLPFSLPWTQLTDLTVNPQITPALCLDILCSCTSLQKLTLREDPWQRASGPPPRTLRTGIFRGRSFTVEVLDGSHALPFLEAVSAPCITKFDLTVSRNIQIEPLLSFFDKSHCGLLHLKLSWADEYPTAAEFEQIITRFPALQHLHLHLAFHHKIATLFRGLQGHAIAMRALANTLIGTLCSLRRSGKLSKLTALHFGSEFDCEWRAVHDQLVPTFVHDMPVRELWLETPLEKDGWVNELPSLSQKVELYGMQSCFDMKAPFRRYNMF